MSDPEKGQVPRGPSKSGYNPPSWFWDTRVKGAQLSGTLTWTALRALDIPLQDWLLRSGAAITLIARLGGRAIAPPIVRPASLVLGLQPYHALLVGLSAGSALKQVYWKWFVGDTSMPAGMSAVIAAYNTFFNTANTLLAVWSLTSQQPGKQSCPFSFFKTAPASVPVGVGLYALGIFLEWYSEVQRKSFKSRPENKGRPYSGGLFSLARHINYTGYTLWRTGYALVCGGWVWAAMVGLFNASDFANRAIPSLDAYCEKRYGVLWDDVREKVPYKLIPGVW